MARNDQPRSYQFWNAINATPNDFNLDAGDYGLTVAAGGFTSFQLQKLMPNGVTYAPITALTAVAGYSNLKLPAGQYQMTLVATAFIGVIEKIDVGRR